VTKSFASQVIGASASFAPNGTVGDPAPDLEALVRDELFEPADPAAEALCEEILRRHGDAVAAVLFYGSCLRKRTSEGVLDFYVVVDSYRAAYHSRALAWGNALLPPNVFYLEIDSELGTLRAKYAVMSMRDFARGAKPGGLRSGIWARFCQPALAVHARDDAARQAVVGIVSDAILTAVTRSLPLFADGDGDGDVGTARFTAEALWLRTLGETYAAELRPESPGSVRALYDADPARYERTARAALTRLYGTESLRGGSDGQVMEIALPGKSQASAPHGGEIQGPSRGRRLRRSSRGRRLRRLVRGRRLRRLLAKCVYFLQLLKTAATFGDWLPYALWKLERHTGNKVVLNERQRRHPFIWGWPLLFRILRQKDLR
jgi:hypothetical protein